MQDMQKNLDLKTRENDELKEKLSKRNEEYRKLELNYKNEQEKLEESKKYKELVQAREDEQHKKQMLDLQKKEQANAELLKELEECKRQLDYQKRQNYKLAVECNNKQRTVINIRKQLKWALAGKDVDEEAAKDGVIMAHPELRKITVANKSDNTQAMTKVKATRQNANVAVQPSLGSTIKTKWQRIKQGFFSFLSNVGIAIMNHFYTR